MTDDAPRIASTLERTKLLVAICLIFFQVPLMFQRINPFGVLLLLGSLYMSLHVMRILSTQVTAVGVSQWTWRGRIQMRWEEVTAITQRNRSIVLTSIDGSVLVPTDSFYDTQAAIDYVDSHLPRNLRKY